MNNREKESMKKEIDDSPDDNQITEQVRLMFRNFIFPNVYPRLPFRQSNKHSTEEQADKVAYRRARSDRLEVHVV